ncbi:MAG: sulfatase-like hydrolase/transferase [Oceanipulchritudo sp.]
MNRRDFIRRSAIGALAAGTAGQVAAGGRDPREKQPNILILQPDQHAGAVLGIAGHPDVQTPNLDRLAANGVRFAESIANAPLCTPWRGMCQTGVYWHSHGAHRNNVRLREDLPGFAESFARAGYATGYIGKWHLDGGIPELQPGGFVPPSRRKGWQEWLGHEKGHDFDTVWKTTGPGERRRVSDYEWEPQWHTDKALDFARRNGKNDTPWLYYVAYGPPHDPEEVPSRFSARYPKDELTLNALQQSWAQAYAPPEKSLNLDSRIRSLLQTYYAQVTAIDEEVGRLVRGLKAMGQLDNTIILYTSDHGDHLGTHLSGNNLNLTLPDGTPMLRGKASPFSLAFKTPMIWYAPGRFKPQCHEDTFFQTADIPSTLLDLAGLQIPSRMQGVSMKPWLDGQNGPRQDSAYLGVNERGWRGIYDGRFVYSPNFAYQGAPGVLYDIQEDPLQVYNRFPERNLRLLLHDQLVSLAEQTGDGPMTASLKDMVLH